MRKKGKKGTSDRATAGTLPTVFLVCPMEGGERGTILPTRSQSYPPRPLVIEGREEEGSLTVGRGRGGSLVKEEGKS